MVVNDKGFRMSDTVLDFLIIESDLFDLKILIFNCANDAIRNKKIIPIGYI